MSILNTLWFAQKIWVFEIQFIPLSSYSYYWWTNVIPTCIYLCCDLLTKMEIPTNTHAVTALIYVDNHRQATAMRIQHNSKKVNDWIYTNGLWLDHTWQQTLIHKLCSNWPRTLRTWAMSSASLFFILPSNWGWIRREQNMPPPPTSSCKMTATPLPNSLQSEHIWNLPPPSSPTVKLSTLNWMPLNLCQVPVKADLISKL